MFTYQTKSGDIALTYESNHLPVTEPAYIFTILSDRVLCNGQDIPSIKSETFVNNPVYATARPITEPTFINLNGHTVSAPEDKNGDGIFKVTTGGVLILEGEGIVNGVGKNDYNMAIWANGGRVIINNGTYTNKGAKAEKDPEHFDLIYASGEGSEIIINDGFFECETPRWTLNRKNADLTSKIIVRGGTFVNYNPAESYTDELPDGQPSNFVDNGFRVISERRNNGDIWYTVIPA